MQPVLDGEAVIGVVFLRIHELVEVVECPQHGLISSCQRKIDVLAI